MGELFGSITVSDTCGLLSHGWCKVDAKGCGHVAHFNHDFDNSIGIRDTCFLPFGNPGSRHSVAFSDSIKMGVHLSVTTKKKDACYQLCSCDHDIELGDFWDGTESVKRNTFGTRGINGCIRAFLQDDDSREVIVDETSKYVAIPKAGSIEMLLKGKNCYFKLIVDLIVDGKNCS
ncbi:hypothetical protein Tco_1332828 [Tanacetum coccineum]